MKVSGGLTEDGVIVGNTFDKYNSKNPVVRRIMQGFHAALNELVEVTDPASIHEVGCGEGYWVSRWKLEGLEARGSDFSPTIVAIANENAAEQGLPTDLFAVRSIYELRPEAEAAGRVVCGEVLEHLEEPRAALEQLRAITDHYLILSVPREPLWSVMNMARGRYWTRLGNTPGHIQRWSQRAFVRLVAQYFDIDRVLAPVPWTMLLCRARDNR